MLWVCRSCTARYAANAPSCPQCGADDHYEQGSEEDIATDEQVMEEELKELEDLDEELGENED